MSRASWLVDGTRIATKIKSACGVGDPGHVTWRSNPTKACPKCQHVIDNSDVSQEWPGLPRGVKFDPSDQEIIWHLITKSGVENVQPHPFIDEFIPTVNEDDGICYTHPRNLPGVKQDGSVAHFFHRAIKAYNTGTRKRRKIHGDSSGDVRWHKTGRTKPVFLDGVQRGCKKIMVLYFSPVRGGKPEKTNWVMHQYHLGTEEDEKDGEYVISKVFYQQQQVKQNEKSELELSDVSGAMITKLDPVTPKSVTPDLPYTGKRFSNFDNGHDSPAAVAQDVSMSLAYTEKRFSNSGYGHEPPATVAQHLDADVMDDEVEALKEQPNCEDHVTEEEAKPDETGEESQKDGGEEAKWWENESPFLLDSQQLVEGLSLCDELLQSQSPSRDGQRSHQANPKPRLSDYAQLGSEHLKKDLEACQDLVVDRDGDFRLSQLEFGSQDSYISWGGGKINFEGGETGS